MTKSALRAIAPAAGLLALQLAAGAALAQPPQLDLPRPSPNATVSQMVGVTPGTTDIASSPLRCGSKSLRLKAKNLRESENLSWLPNCLQLLTTNNRAPAVTSR